ncbi:hypothetical protein FRC09_006599 [Ceratobasidium sp. 395]|nr:hypothetical protein FRC09_006599 [Ceratobasidium sp. 395]
MHGRTSQSPPAAAAGSPGSRSGSGSGANSDSSSSPGVDPVSGEITPWMQEILLATMVANRHRYNFYLHPSVLEYPPQPLLNAMNLVACHILTSSAGPNTRPSSHDLDTLKPLLLSKVYSGIHVSLENARDLLAGAVCAPALAAQYLLEVGRFAEAQWLASNAIRFAVSSGIHTIATHRPSLAGTPEPVRNTGSPSPVLGSPSPSFLVPPRNAQEHHDRLMTWWLAYIADGLVEVVAGLPSALRAEILVCLGDMEAYLGGATGIPAVFPLPEIMYESASSQVDVQSINISQLLQGTIPQGVNCGSGFSASLKAFTFYHAAVLIDDCHRTGRPIDEDTPSKIYANILAFVERARNHVNHAGVASACILAHTATIRLYGTTFLIEEQRRRAEAASAIARLSSNLDREEMHAQTQLLERCCSEALEFLRSGAPGTEAASAHEFQTLFSLLEQLRGNGFN